MALPNQAAIQQFFKVFGKMINLSLVGTSDVTTYKAAIMASVRQEAIGDGTEYDAFTLAMLPLHTSVNTLVRSVATLPGSVQAAAELYLKNVVAPTLGLAITSTPAVIGAALATQMNATSTTVAPSGSGGSNANGFAMYFYNTWNVTLNQAPSGTGNCLDAWITGTVV